MSHMLARIEASKRHRVVMACRAFLTDQDLIEKFEIIASGLWADPLGWCGLPLGVEYPIHRIERNGVDVFVYVDGLPPVSWRYRLPTAYGEMVTNADIARVNIGLRCYTIHIATKVCGPTVYPLIKRVYVGPSTEPPSVNRVDDVRWQIQLVYHV